MMTGHGHVKALEKSRFIGKMSDEILNHKFWCSTCCAFVKICITSIVYSKSRAITCKDCTAPIATFQEN